MEVLIAIIAAGTALLVESIRRGFLDRRLIKAVGKPNGKGSVVQMNEQQLDLMHDAKVDQQHINQEIADLKTMLGTLTMAMHEFEQFSALIRGVRFEFEDRFKKMDRRIARIEDRLDLVEARPSYRVPDIPARRIDRDVNS